MGFKHGDKIKCVCSSGVESHLTVGKEYEVIGNLGLAGKWVKIVKADTGNADEFRASRFELSVKQPNGVDASGNRIHFSKTDLKPNMRIRTRGGNVYVVYEDGKGLFGVREGGSFFGVSSNAMEDLTSRSDASFNIEEVYSAPDHRHDFANPHVNGELLWKREDDKLKPFRDAVDKAQAALAEAEVVKAEEALAAAKAKLESFK